MGFPILVRWHLYIESGPWVSMKFLVAWAVWGRALSWNHYDDAIMGTIASQITSLPSVYSTVYSGADQSKHQSSASLAFVWGIHRGPVNSPHKWPVTRKMFPFDDVIMETKLFWRVALASTSLHTCWFMVPSITISSHLPQQWNLGYTMTNGPTLLSVPCT